MSGKTVLKDKNIAGKRVRVKRDIVSAKTLKILRNPLKHIESLLASDIGFVCFVLVNFRWYIVLRNAYFDLTLSSK